VATVEEDQGEGEGGEQQDEHDERGYQHLRRQLGYEYPWRSCGNALGDGSKMSATKEATSTSAVKLVRSTMLL